MNLLKTVYDFSTQHNLIPVGSTIILGLSGGPDSVFLLHALAPLAHAGTIKLIAAHLDHGWRQESQQDVEFCRSLTEKLALPLVTAHLTELEISLRYNGSHEELGRKARRFFFDKLRKEYQADRVALAHHQDDQEETFFIRLVRGSSLSGLTAMKPHQDAYIRPLLTIAKADIIAYLTEHNIPFLVDPTNASDDFLRNRLRNHALPALHASDTRFSHNFSRTLQSLQETESFLHELTQQTFDALSNSDDLYGCGINQQLFLASHPVIQQRMLLLWLVRTKTSCTPSQTLFEEIIRFMRNTKSIRHQLLPSTALIKKNNSLYLNKTAPSHEQS